jgi:hypothetical protein
VKVLKIINATATKENIRKAKEFLSASRVDDQVVLFAAGHGLLDDDMNFYFATAKWNLTIPRHSGCHMKIWKVFWTESLRGKN